VELGAILLSDRDPLKPCCVLLAVIVPLLLVGAGAAPAAGPVGGAPAAAKKCKKGTVRVVVGKKRSCRPLKKALPRPRKGDPRLIYVRSALGANLSGVRDRRGRRPPSIDKALRRISPRAVKGLERVIPRALRLLDRGKARAAQGGGSVGFTYDLGNGASIDVRANLAQANIEVAVTGRRNGQSIRTRIGINRDLGFRGPDCPTAAGVLDAKDGLRVAISTEFLDSGGHVDYYYTQVVFQDTKLHGQVGDHAKLDTLEVTDTLQIGEITGGSIFGGVNIESKIKRHTVVDMKNGHYDPGRSDVSVSVALSGILRIFQSSAQAGARERLQAAADKGFAATVERAMRNYRERESAWQTPDKCATARLTPTNNSITLGTGQRGSIRGEVTANQGGGKPPTATWTVSGQQNASFTPGPRGNPGSVDYVVGVVPPGSKVKARLKAVSRAGVAQADWEQNTRGFTINKIAGNFSGSYSVPVGSRTGVISWTGSATFERTTPPGTPGALGNYVLKAGSVSFTYSGGSIVGDALCDMSGNTFVDLFQHGGGSIGVTPVGSAVFEPGPHNYGATVTVGPTPRVTLTESNCADPSHNGTTHDYPVFLQPLDTGPDLQLSPDGIHYEGNRSESGGGITTQWAWVFTGSE
jgi:hypothetical protein